MNRALHKNMALWVVILVVILLVVTMLRQEQLAPPDIAYSQFVQRLQQGQVEGVTIEENQIIGRLRDGTEFSTYAPAMTPELLQVLVEKGVSVVARPQAGGGFWRQVLIMWFPLLLFIGLWIFFIRQMQARSLYPRSNVVIGATETELGSDAIDLSEFVRLTIDNVISGVAAAQESAKEAGGEVNPAGESADRERVIEFDVPVVAAVTEAEVELGGQHRLVVVASEFSSARTGEGEGPAHVRFSVPVVLPEGGRSG
jgi:hypothetical protein